MTPPPNADSGGLYEKYTIVRNDGREKPNARYFVLDYFNDPHARKALSAYAESVHRKNPDLASDLRRELIEINHPPPNDRSGAP